MKGTGCARGAPASVEHGGNTAAGRFENFAAGANNPPARLRIRSLLSRASFRAEERVLHWNEIQLRWLIAPYAIARPPIARSMVSTSWAGRNGFSIDATAPRRLAMPR